jgi:hypothetical protein
VDFDWPTEGDEPNGEPVDRHAFRAPAKNLRKCGLVRAASQPLQLGETLMENPNERDQYDFSILLQGIVGWWETRGTEIRLMGIIPLA